MSAKLDKFERSSKYISPPSKKPNYPSAEEHEDAIEATYMEDRDLGLTSGPHTPEEAAAICGCRPHELCHGALAGKLEGRYVDKLRTGHHTQTRCVQGTQEDQGPTQGLEIHDRPDQREGPGQLGGHLRGGQRAIPLGKARGAPPCTTPSRPSVELSYTSTTTRS
jgi:hypothetical protein